MNEIELKSVKELEGMKFFVPEYQRGYRWEKQQVEDLLDDIKDFSNRQEKKEGEFYCLQPLVVREMEEEEKEKNNLEKSETWYEVIDGQQRLTTIFIILKCLGKEIYGLSYATRDKSETFLKNIDKEDKKIATKNIDFFYMFNAYKKVSDWFSKKSEEFKKDFGDVLLKQVKFIWYKPVEDDSVKVFTRLNVGKISLTNAELIKALFLNRSNFKYTDMKLLRFQQDIASKWDEIERELQKEDFWLFLRENEKYTNPTRIDFIFDIICDENKLEMNKKEYQNFISEKIDRERDKYRTFRYFYEYFKKEGNEKAIESWEKTWDIFKAFKEWYMDIDLYNYVGYLIVNNTTVATLLKERETKDKEAFEKYLIDEIKKKIGKCRELEKQYETTNNPKKQCLPLLLLHNIQTEINREEKFPFHRYKSEKWEVEHIDSATTNDESNKDEQNEWLCNIFNAVDEDGQKKIKDFVNDETKTKKDFDEMKKLFPISTNTSLSELKKDQIMNFALLDKSTNSGYGNAIFASKRRIIMGKAEGKLIPVPKVITKNEKPFLDTGGDVKLTSSKFIPVCTKKVFEKAYSSATSNINYWDESDAEAYKKDIFNTLHDTFGVEYILNKGKNNE